MWQSEDDIVKDLAILNDFGAPGDQESHKFLNSVGRGLKMKKKKKITEEFIDPRTGEVIKIKDSDILDPFYESKGRGTLLGNFSKSKLQLQQQLRMARPLGSGDEAVESYYRRNWPAENLKTGKDFLVQNQMDPEFKNIIYSKVSENPRADPNTGETKVRVKGVRNSTVQCNALIENLLCKSKKNSDVKLISGNCSHSNSDISIDDDSNNNSDDNINVFNEFKGQSSSSQDMSSASELNEEKDFLEKKYDRYYRSAKNKKHEHFEIIYDEKKKEHDGRFKKPEEKPNVLDGINSEINGRATHDFRKIWQSINSPETQSRNELGDFVSSNKSTFLYNEYDFPPLKKK